MTEWIDIVVRGADQIWVTVLAAWAAAQPSLEVATSWLANPWSRALGLFVIVLLTIVAIALVYSGNLQNAEIGPVSIRPHTTTRASLSGVIMPKDLNVPFSMDGVSADVSVIYVYHDARNRRRSVKLLTHEMRLLVQPGRLSPVQNTIYGFEVPDVPQESVCYPNFTIDEAPTEVGKTADRAPEYVQVNKLLDRWTEDDNAVLISVPKAMHEEAARRRNDFIIDHVAAWEKARNGGFLTQGKARRLARERPNVIGSYYIKFQFKSNPWFVLFKHPDRDLKMTAWLTVLTSMFALLMDAWPKAPPPDLTIQPPVREAPNRVPRVPAPR